MAAGFLKYYEQYNTSLEFKNFYTRSEEGMYCRFCRKSFPAVSFKTAPHIIPELFGRNSITSNFECDECNKRFQKCETDASTMVQHYLTMLNIRSKKGVPIFQSRKQPGDYPTTIQVDGANRTFNFGENLDHFEYDELAKTITIYFKTKKFSPFSFYKVLLKMGLSLLSEDDLSFNEHYLGVLNSEEPVKPHIYSAWRYVLKTRYFEVPVATLYRGTNTLLDGRVQLPEYFMTLVFSNVVFQMFLPFSVKNAEEYVPGNSLHFELFPSFGMDDIYRLQKVEMHHMDLGRAEKITLDDKMVLHYDSKESDIVE